MILICNRCGNNESTECCAVGEDCYLGCGGTFVEHKTTVEHVQEGLAQHDHEIKLYKIDDMFYDEGQKEKDPTGRDQHAPELSTQDLIRIKCDECKELLLEKNREYGDSALHPLGIFSRLTAIEAIKIRIDDKLARIQFGGQKNIKEDTVLDLIGYLVLMRVCEAVNSNDAEG